MRHGVVRATALSAAIAAVVAYSAAPAAANTIHVTANAPDAVASDGKCSLREAINAANQNGLVNAPDCDTAGGSTNDLIVLPSGQYTLAAGGAGDNANASGDLDLTGTVAIEGAGASSTAIVGNGDRVIDVQPNASARLIGVTIRGGTTPAGADSAVDGVSGTSAASGAGVLNQGTLTVVDSVITQNTTGDGGDGGLGASGGSGGNGAGIASPGPLTLVDSTVSDNTTGAGGAGGASKAGSAGGAGGDGGGGAGVLTFAGSTFTRTTIQGNHTGVGGAGGHGDPLAPGKGGLGGSAAGLAATRSVVLADSVVRDNTSGKGGNAGAATSTRAAGGAGGSGAGVLVAEGGSSLDMSGTTISGNTAGDGGRGTVASTGFGGFGGEGGRGGGLYSEGLGVTIARSRIASNRSGAGGRGGTGGGGAGPAAAGAWGGGAFLNAAAVKITSTTFADNVAGDGADGEVPQAGGPATIGGFGGAGGGLFVQGSGAAGDGTVEVVGSTFSGNHAGNGGTGHASTGAPPGQLPGGSGGGLFTNGVSTTVVNSTFSGNTAGRGTSLDIPAGTNGSPGGPGGSGGGIVVASELTVTHSTVASNDVGPGGTGSQQGAAGAGGGIANAIPTPTKLGNSVLASNGGGNCSGLFTDQDHNIDFPDSACPGAAADPLLGPLQDNGGPTFTRAIGTSGAAFDQVPSTGAGCPATDQRGQPRPKGAACDIGAFEADPPAPAAPGDTGGGTQTPSGETPGGGGGGPVGGGTTPGGTDSQPTILATHLTLKRQSLGAALSKGYVAQFDSNEASTGVLEVFAEGSDARGLKVAATKRVARGTKKLAKAGKASVTAKFTRKARSRFGHRRTVKLLVRLTVRDAGGAKSVQSKRVVLKR